jgi:hypothetical protein
MGQYGVVGDPTGMRNLASQLVAYANALRTIRSSTRKKWSNVKFEGPFARTVNDVLTTRLADLESAAAQLDDTAKLLRSAATRVDVEIMNAKAIHDAEQRLREQQAAAGRAAGTSP